VLAGIDLGMGGALSNGVDGGFCATLEMQFHQDVARDDRRYGLIVRREGHNQEIHDLQALPEGLTGPSG
jgi:hypothetical protein